MILFLIAVGVLASLSIAYLVGMLHGKEKNQAEVIRVTEYQKYQKDFEGRCNELENENSYLRRPRKFKFEFCPQTGVCIAEEVLEREDQNLLPSLIDLPPWEDTEAPNE